MARLKCSISLENVTCFNLALRTPRPGTEPRDGPTQNFHEKCRKSTLGPQILDSQKLPPKYPENTKKYPQNTKNARFGYFFRYFGVFSWDSRISAPGGIFSAFFVEIPGRAISGLCSRSGRSQISRAQMIIYPEFFFQDLGALGKLWYTCSLRVLFS